MIFETVIIGLLISHIVCNLLLFIFFIIGFGLTIWEIITNPKANGIVHAIRNICLSSAIWLLLMTVSFTAWLLRFRDNYPEILMMTLILSAISQYILIFMFFKLAYGLAKEHVAQDGK